MDDDRLEALAAKLGAEGEGRVSPDRVAETVVERLRAEPVDALRAARRRVPWWVHVAAAAVLVAATVLGIQHQLRERALRPIEFAAVSPSLEELAAPELAEVMDSLDVEAPVAEMVIGLQDLSEEQLELLLRRLEG